MLKYVSGVRAIAPNPYNFFLACQILSKFVPNIPAKAKDFLEQVGIIGLASVCIRDGYTQIQQGNKIRGSIAVLGGTLGITLIVVSKIWLWQAEQAWEGVKLSLEKRKLCQNQLAKEMFYNHGYCTVWADRIFARMENTSRCTLDRQEEQAMAVCNYPDSNSTLTSNSELSFALGLRRAKQMVRDICN